MVSLASEEGLRKNIRTIDLSMTKLLFKKNPKKPKNPPSNCEQVGSWATKHSSL